MNNVRAFLVYALLSNYEPSPEGVRGGELNLNVIMKKIFMYAMIAFVGIALMSCDKDKNNADEPKTDNPYPYLRVDDLMPLELLSLSQAEAKLANMGFNGGLQKYKIEDGKYSDEYLYTSSDKRDTVFLGHDTQYGVVTVLYKASKGVVPSSAIGWLSHFPENITIPQKAIEISGQNNLPFSSAWTRNLRDGEIIANANTYSKYINLISDLTTGIEIGALWGTLGVTNSWPSGYYGGVIVYYNYVDNKDFAAIDIAFFYHEHKDLEPIMPPDAE